MTRSLPGMIASFILVASPLASITAQTSVESAIRTVYLEDLATLESKFNSLSAAFPEADFDWRPMEGVRSVREVVGMIAAENSLMLATMFDKELPSDWTAHDTRALMAGTTMSREEMLSHLARSFDFAEELWEGLSEEELAADHNFFGRQRSGTAIAMSWLADQHEHLGQLIAYARANEIVPPWSRGQGG